MKLFIMLISGIFISVNANAEWNNPSERYVDAYKIFLDATCPLPQDEIKHFVYFAQDREAIHNHPCLNHSRFEGAQIIFPSSGLKLYPGIHYLCAFKS